MYYVYVIYSSEHDRFYHGMAANLDTRLNQHNLGKVRSTKAFTPWSLVYSEEFKTLEEARERELFFKTSTGRKFLKPIKEKVRAQNS